MAAAAREAASVTLIPAPASARICSSPTEILQVGAIERRQAPGRGLQDVLAAVGDEAAAHKGQVRGAVEAEEVADGIDEHHGMAADFRGRL